MSAVVEVIVLVDTAGLLRDYPQGIPEHRIGDTRIENYFKIMTDKAHAYVDPHPDANRTEGVKCLPGDMLYFRAISTANQPHGVIIMEFALKSQGVPANDLANYLSIPQFRSSIKSAYTYDNRKQANLYINDWQGWRIWAASLEGPTQFRDPHMYTEALQSTMRLEHQHILYTLGFRVTYAGVDVQYWFDPAIRILDDAIQQQVGTQKPG